MFTALALSLALGAPVPAPAAPAAAGVAPQVMEIKPDANGKIIVNVTRTTTQNLNVPNANPNGLPAIGGVFSSTTKQEAVELGDVKDLTITTADGRAVTKEAALKKLATGGIVIVSGDGNAVSPAYLKAFKDDVLVLASPELMRSATQNLRFGNGGGLVVPGGAPGPIQLQGPGGGVIQIQIGQGGVLPVVPPAPVPVPEK